MDRTAMRCHCPAKHFRNVRQALEYARQAADTFRVSAMRCHCPAKHFRNVRQALEYARQAADTFRVVFGGACFDEGFDDFDYLLGNLLTPR